MDLRSEQKYRLIFEALDDAIFVADLETHTIIDANRQAEVLSGRSRDEIIGIPMEGLHPPNFISQHDGQFRKYVSAGRFDPDLDAEILHKDGRIIPVSCGTTIIESDGRKIIIGVFRDITRRQQAKREQEATVSLLRQTEQALRASEERYRHLVELSPDAIYIHQQGRLVFINAAGLRLFGAERPEQILGKSMLELIHPDYREVVAQRIELIQGQRQAVPLLAEKVIRLDGTVQDMEAAAAPLDHNGQPAVLVIARDISERVRAEEALLERASLRKLSHRILQGQEEERRRISRELHDEAGQALTAIKLNTELLAQRVPDNLPALKQLAQDTAEVTASLISEMRRIAAALRPTVLEDLGLLPTLRWYTKGVEMRYGLRVKLISRGLKGRLDQSFETTIYRIVQEALTNVVRHAQAKHVTVKVTCGKRGLDLLIEDDGRGLDAGRVRKGTGLTGIRERAHLFAGTMSLKSQVGEGTTLRIKFRNIPEAGS